MSTTAVDASIPVASTSTNCPVLASRARVVGTAVLSKVSTDVSVLVSTINEESNGIVAPSIGSATMT